MLNSSQNPSVTNPRLTEMPDIFGGADKKRRPATVTILKPLPEVYAYFRDFSHFPLFMTTLASIEDRQDGVYVWTAAEAFDGASWETHLFVDEAPHRLAWRTREEGEPSMVAAVTFEPALEGRATVMSFKMLFPSATGRLRSFFQRFWGEDPDTEAEKTLRRFKALLETGEIPTTQGQPSGREATDAAA